MKCKSRGSGFEGKAVKGHLGMVGRVSDQVQWSGCEGGGRWQAQF